MICSASTPGRAVTWWDLAALETGWEAAAEGPTLVHADLRADNILLAGDRMVVVDWPWACLAAPWFDLVAMLPSVHMQGGPSPETLFGDHRPGPCSFPASLSPANPVRLLLVQALTST